MKSIKIFALSLLITLSGCITEPNTDSSDKDSENEIIIKTGKSFGFCVGYCSLEATITSANIKFVSSSWDANNYPTKIQNIETDENYWNDILDKINMDNFEKLDDVIGCPDCADGGSEWIEIIYPDRNKKVTFEYGDSLEGMNELLKILREIRNKYNEKHSSDNIDYVQQKIFED